MIWTELEQGLIEALRREDLYTEERARRIELAIPRERSHGDWTTNLALVLAKDAKRPPRQIAEALQRSFPARPDVISAVEVAGAGFLNFRYSDAFLAELPARILGDGEGFGRSDRGGRERILVEYVSANPTGPMNVVSARAAAVGSTLVRLLRAAGHDADGEFYVNDAGNQVDLLGESVAARFAERIGVPRAFPEDGYRGSYLHDVAARLPESEARTRLDSPDAKSWFRQQALEKMLAWQQHDLGEYGVHFDRWFRESELHDSGAVETTRRELESRGMAYRASGPQEVSEAAQARVGKESGGGEATWIRTCRFGDDMDRVIVRADGRPTYLLPDIAYHRDKHARGYRHVINLWGPDHHAYVGTLTAALRALGLDEDFLRVLIVQQVNLLRDGQEVKMSKRAGEFVTLADLVEEVGADCAKFFFLMRSTSSHLDFDLTLARQQNDENPAFYVQYAHARISSVIRYAAERGLEPATGPAAAPASEGDRALVRQLATFPEVVRGAAVAREPHRLPAYLVETAAEFHRFYHACRVVSDDRALSQERLRLAAAARQVLRNGLALMGVSAPERLERTEETHA